MKRTWTIIGVDEEDMPHAPAPRRRNRDSIR